MNTGIYKILNIITNDCYIGSAVNLNRRFLTHKAKLRNNTHHSIILQAAYNKYGIDAFKFDILLYCDKTTLLFYEQRAIDCYNPKYNICRTAGNSLGYKHSAKSKIKMSIKASIRNKNSRGNYIGGRHTKKHSEETKMKMSVIKQGNQNHLGHKHSEETKKKISDSMKRTKGLKREVLPV